MIVVTITNHLGTAMTQPTTKKPRRDSRADWKQLRSADQRAPTGSGGGRKGTPNDHPND